MEGGEGGRGKGEWIGEREREVGRGRKGGEGGEGGRGKREGKESWREGERIRKKGHAGRKEWGGIAIAMLPSYLHIHRLLHSGADARCVTRGNTRCGDHHP